MIISLDREKKIILSFLIILVTICSYILYLNLYIIELKDDLTSRENLYKIQINNRINEIDQLNVQLKDLHTLLNIGLDLTQNNNVFYNTKLTNVEKDFILRSIPNSAPVQDVFITSSFGNRIHPVLGTMKFHYGIDLRAKIRTEIYATADGIVLKSNTLDRGGYGKSIKISHNYGFSTLYGHLEEVFVEEGSLIKKGTLIGLSGNTGRSNGPHLHYEVQYLNKPLNPTAFLYWNKKTFNSILQINDEIINWENMINFIKSNRQKGAL